MPGSTTRRRAFASLAGLCACALFAAQAQAQTPAPAAPDFARIELRPVRLADNFYVIDEAVGLGGTVSFLIGTDGVLIVDPGLRALAPKVEAAIRRLSPLPVRYVVNTHVHLDGTEGNEHFGRLGAVVVATEAVRDNLSRAQILSNGQPRPAAPAPAMPTATFTQDMALHFGGQEIRLIAAPRAHTDGDALIYFPQLDIIVVGDVLRPNDWPSINRHESGTLPGMLDALARVIGTAGPKTRLVTGHGEVVGRQVAVAQRDMIIAVRDRIGALIAQGRSADQVVAANVTADLGVAALVPHTSAERFVRDVYAELKIILP